MPEIEIPGLYTLRHLNRRDIMRLRQIRGPNRAIAPFTFAAGMTIAVDTCNSLPLAASLDRRAAVVITYFIKTNRKRRTKPDGPGWR